MVRRAKFQTKIDFKSDDLEEIKQNEFIAQRIANDNPVVDLPIEKVFAFNRFKRPLNILWIITFFTLWTPFGIVLFFIRLSILITFLLFFYIAGGIPKVKNVRKYAPPVFINVICPLMGVFHSVRGGEFRNAVFVDKTIFVCNHISNFDPIWFNSIFYDFTLLCAGDYDWFWEAMKRIGLLNVDDQNGKGCIYTNYFGSKEEREEVRTSIEEDMARSDARPFLIYPEGCVTSGHSSVMQYQQFVFSLDKVIVPMCLSVYNPWPYEHYTLSAGAKHHLMWYLFSPFIIFKHALLAPQKIRVGEKPRDFALRVQCMTAAHLGLGVIKMNWKQKDRLAQALGFVPYDANYWSRRESMDNFKEALFNRQVVLKDGIAYSTKTERTFAGEDKEEEGKIPKNKVVPAKPENPSMKSLQTMRELPLEEQEKHGVVLAREYAARAHAEREEEMKIFDETMKKVAEERKKKRGSIRRVGAKGAGFVDQNANAEMVNKVNNLRRRSSVGGVQVPELKVFAKEVQEKGEFVQEKRRKSSIAMSQQQVEVLSGKSPGGISEEGMKALQEAAAVAQAEQDYQEEQKRLREERKQAEKVEENV
mmetsp:Transcript_14462/g.26717  ORF Transcript_14462/g.26717 Transcript_14462/m.26717 type:complete len:589 (+) Transcript_14462:258-2024(+)|eukprot:CAMPEP_0182501076 /NCGR_PEP_ID=MMETSP1321-20130603/10530_1 /TAXON_ID=91990 /ORGANISM="Bolidomonas sp., Strain RCC1657" /LENGTH=588 /DNA_ID=CAMNT_0024705677 /DNA_START=205 /DNA_END=1971 /DNA_ORIENTATION=-